MSNNKNCETLIKRTHREVEETLEFKLTKSRETFSFKPPILIDGSWVKRLPSLKVYSSISNITEDNNKLELFTDFVDEFSFEEKKDELEEIVNISNISHEHLQDELLGPRILSEFRKLATQKGWANGYIMLLMGFAKSPFRDFEKKLS